MQRLGRKGHPTYRVVVQDSRQSPSSGKYVALLGSYDPHTKQSTLVKEKAEFYLTHGAQPSDRVVTLFKTENVKLPKWVADPTKQKREIRNPEKLRKNRPAEDKPAADEEKVEEVTPEPDQSVDDKAAVESSDEATKEESSAEAHKAKAKVEETENTKTEENAEAKIKTSEQEKTKPPSEKEKPAAK